MQMAHLFDYVIPNHDGEDSENWEQFYHPLGDARRSLMAFVAILKGEATGYAEKWTPELLGADAENRSQRESGGE
jgi:guanylate kinase